MTKILITGGSGFIGTNLINHLLNMNNYTILSIDKEEPKIKLHHSIWRQIDICDSDSVNQIIHEFQPDYVIHLAARTDLRGKELNDYSANTDGVTNLLNALENTPSIKRVIFTSSMYVCEPGYMPKDFEDYAPHTLYGKSKREVSSYP